MRGGALLALLAAVVACGCASEGGVTGTGISASVTGNVRLVTDEPSPLLDALPAIRVTVDEAPDVVAVTDPSGTFVLRGAFSGRVTLQFALADSGAALGPLTLEIPAGSETVLENIEIRTAAPEPERVRPAAIRQFDVFGRVDVAECVAAASGTLLISDDSRPPRQFLVRITDDTRVTDRDGTPRPCADARPGTPVRVEGLLQRDDQTIAAGSVVLAAARPAPTPGPRRERLRGVVRAAACDRGLIEVEQRGSEDRQRRAVQLSERTDIVCAGDPPQPCGCADLLPGRAIGLTGTLFPDRPGVIVAETVIVDAALRPVNLIAIVATVACETGTVVLRDASTPSVSLRAVLTRGTEVFCGRRACACADLRPRDRLRLEGFSEAGRADIVYAQRLTVLPAVAGRGP